jgi:hypothetical protein
LLIGALSQILGFETIGAYVVRASQAINIAVANPIANVSRLSPKAPNYRSKVAKILSFALQ